MTPVPTLCKVRACRVGTARRLSGLLLLLAVAATSVYADEVEMAHAAAIERIARERAAIERESQVARAACAQHFAVTACVERVNADRRVRVLGLDRQRAVLDNDLRMRRAAARMTRIEQRRAGRADEVASATVTARSRPASAPVASPVRPATLPASAAAARATAASQAQAAASARADAAARRAAQAQAHRSAIEKRNRERAAQKAPAKPLPLPPEASR